MVETNTTLIGKASPHTIKKFELIENYVETWAQKLLQNRYCKAIIFIDCMCNSGLYHDSKGELAEGTPIRIAKKLREAAGQYPNKKIWIYLNDLSSEKIELLKTMLPKEKKNFHYIFSVGDGNDLLKRIGPKLYTKPNHHFFLFYDPFEATIDWDALAPFFRSWGEVLINHMLYDSVRAVKQAKSPEAMKKYEDTYLSAFEDLVPYGSDRCAYEKRVEEIIKTLKGSANREYYIASFPFFNSNNSLMYDLIHCTGNIAGFRLFKTTAWKTFGGKSSTKNTHGLENQYMLDFEQDGTVTTMVDESCYYVKDIADYLQNHFCGQVDVPCDDIWAVLDKHPVFPYNGYRREIINELKNTYGATVGTKKISFTNRC